MFIIGWLVLLILKANEFSIPTIVSVIVGIMAILEALIYVAAIVLEVISARNIKKSEWF